MSNPETHSAAATTAAGLHIRALADLHSRLVVDGGVAHALLDLTSHGQESLLNVASVLRRGLQEWDTKAVGKFLFASQIDSVVPRLESGSHLRNRVLHDLLVRHIALVTDQQLVHALCGVAVNLLQPLLDVVERIHVSDIVDDTDAVSATVV